MNKKGFTLVEILIVIVLISLLVGIGIPSISKISTNMKKKSLSTKIDLIEQAGVLWGQDNKTRLNNKPCFVEDGNTYKCYPVTIEDLIKGDYLDGEDNTTTYTNPVTGEDITNTCVLVYKKNNRVYAKYDENNNSGTICGIDQIVVTIPTPTVVETKQGFENGEFPYYICKYDGVKEISVSGNVIDNLETATVGVRNGNKYTHLSCYIRVDENTKMDARVRSVFIEDILGAENSFEVRDKYPAIVSPDMEGYGTDGFTLTDFNKYITCDNKLILYNDEHHQTCSSISDFPLRFSIPKSPSNVYEVIISADISYSEGGQTINPGRIVINGFKLITGESEMKTFCELYEDRTGNQNIPACGWSPCEDLNLYDWEYEDCIYMGYENYVFAPSCNQDCIIDMMMDNSTAWNNTTNEAAREALHEENIMLAQEFTRLTGIPTQYWEGYWTFETTAENMYEINQNGIAVYSN